ncbi:uncharacterized protein LOC116412964 [Galleria mellonella]|uniref:Uncharacterized protein LOC116412964 n=1 Tax=Galleria mellonella TaxID=7137 RepID=A0A6J3BZU2_GALME|nr:uncharacterized protein LOC116412964 [Galleria mellonella]
MLMNVFTWMACMTTLATSRDTLKGLKPSPTITNSLVNLGKMDISFHFNTKESPLQLDSLQRPFNTFLFSKPPLAPISEEPCPCSGIRSIKDSILGHPSEIINKILMNNNLFSFNKEPDSSSLCCDSHEHVQEDVVTFEFGPKQMDIKSLGVKSLPLSPFLFEDVVPRNPSLPTLPLKQKAMEIYLFPKKKDVPFDFEKIKAKSDPAKTDKKLETIQIVGDKDLKDNFKNWKLRSTVAFPTIRNNVTAEVKDIAKVGDKGELSKLQINTTANKLNSVL